jgi:hypothetical protein
MHPSMSYELAQARIADLQRQASRDAIAKAARQARRARQEDDCKPPARRAAGVLARRLRAALAARSG